MKTVAEATERILRLYYGDDITDEDRMTTADVQGLLSQAVAYQTKQSLYENMKVEGSRVVNPTFYATYENVEVLEDTNQDNYYLTLPKPVVLLPNEIGLEIYYMKDRSTALIPVTPTFQFLTKNNVATNLQGNAGYFVDNATTIRFVNLTPLSTMPKFLLRMIVDFSSFEDYEELPVPTEAMAMAIEWVLSKLPPRQNATSVTPQPQTINK